jgi:hypothetical protein
LGSRYVKGDIHFHNDFAASAFSELTFARRMGWFSIDCDSVVYFPRGLDEKLEKAKTITAFREKTGSQK